MMKYIVTAHDGQERIYLFPAVEQHKDFAECLCVGSVWKPIRGGFVMFEEGMKLPKCFGEAFSLGLVSDKVKDTAMLLRLFAA